MDLHDTLATANLFIFAVRVFTAILFRILHILSILLPALSLVLVHIRSRALDNVNIAFLSYSDLLTDARHR